MSTDAPTRPPGGAPAWRTAAEALAVAALALWTVTRAYDHPMVFNADGVRDLLAAVDLRHGERVAAGPGVLPLRFFLSPLYTHLLATLLAARPSLAFVALAEHASLAAGAGLLYATARRWLPAWGALLAALCAVNSATLVGAHQTFTHSAFMLPFELGALLALFASLRRDRPWLLAAACAGFGAALQLHTAVFPLLLLLAVPAWWHRRTRAFGWGWAALAAFALVAPMALYVHSAVVWGRDLARASAIEALGALLRQHSLPLVVAALVACARPAALRRRERATVAAVALLPLVALALALASNDRVPVALFNMHFNPFLGSEPTGNIAGSGWLGGAATLLWPLAGVPNALRPALAAAPVVGVALWAAGRGASPRDGERAFVLAWAALAVPPALWFLARVDAISVRYALHASPVLALAAATGLVTVLRWPAALLARALAGRLPRAPWGDPLLALLLAAGAVVAASRLPRVASRDLMDGRTVESAWRALVPVLGSPAAVASRSHGGTGQAAWGDAANTMWLFPPTLLWPDRGAGAGDGETHVRIFLADARPLPVGAARLPGTVFAYARYRAAIDGTRATAREGADPASPWRPMPLPARVVVRERPYLPAWLHLVALNEMPGRSGALALRVPLRAGAGGALTIAAVSPNVMQPCAVAATLAGAPLVVRSHEGSATTFALPPSPHDGTLDVAIDRCTPVFIDAYDQAPL